MPLVYILANSLVVQIVYTTIKEKMCDNLLYPHLLNIFSPLAIKYRISLGKLPLFIFDKIKLLNKNCSRILRITLLTRWLELLEVVRQFKTML